MANGFCSPDTAPSYPKWTAWDAIKWKLLPTKVGGGKVHLYSYKDSWILYNRNRIRDAAGEAEIPVYLLAAVAWEEVGGKPDFVKKTIVYPIRDFDWSGPDWVDEHLTMSSHPHKTSFGAVSIQLGVAAKTLGLDPMKLDLDEQWKFIKCLETDAYNLKVVAKHLYDLIMYDFPNADTKNLTDEQIAVVGSRYNRGIERKLNDFINSLQAAPGTKTREYTEYGRTMLRRRERILELLNRRY